MKIPCLTIRIDGDDLVVLYAGLDKSKALETAKAEANKPHDIHAEYRVVQAVGAGIAWRRRVTPAVAPLDVAALTATIDVEVVESDPEDTEVETSADAKAVREALKAKGVKVPPRIGIDALLKLAIENGVEV
jgi:hypothetical protein